MKTNGEVDLIREISRSSSYAHTQLMRAITSKDSEFEAEAFYLSQTYACLLRRQGYTAIVASGYNAAILHYTDNSEYFSPNSMLLIDAGGEFKGTRFLLLFSSYFMLSIL